MARASSSIRPGMSGISSITDRNTASSSGSAAGAGVSAAARGAASKTSAASAAGMVGKAMGRGYSTALDTQPAASLLLARAIERRPAALDQPLDAAGLLDVA